MFKCVAVGDANYLLPLADGSSIPAVITLCHSKCSFSVLFLVEIFYLCIPKITSLYYVTFRLYKILF